MRNLIKSRGLIPFKDHFCVPAPAQLVKYQKTTMDLCGLSKAEIGKHGTQGRAIALWINSKRLEIGSSPFCVSVSIDAKKIAVTEKGIENMGSSEEKEILEPEFSRLELFIKQDDRKNYYALYDDLTTKAEQIVSRMCAVEKLIARNENALERNPILGRYIFVLKTQLDKADKLLIEVALLQYKLVCSIAGIRNCVQLLPTLNRFELVNQENFRALKPVSDEEDAANGKIIGTASKGKVAMYVDWESLLPKLSRSPQEYGRYTSTVFSLLNRCTVSSTQVFSACGLGRSRPLAEMKDIYKQAYSLTSGISGPSGLDSVTDLTFCSVVAPMMFGNNCVIQEAGIFISSGICAFPNLLVLNESNEIEYTVRTQMCKSNLFDLTLEELLTSLVDSYICRSVRGSLFAKAGKDICVVFSIPVNQSIAKEALSFIKSLLRMDKCLSKRTPTMLQQITTLQTSLQQTLSGVTVVGSYPLIKDSKSLNDFLSCHEDDKRLIGERIKSLYVDVKDFLAKKANQLIAVNVSDLSGNISSTPHTIVAATYLSSQSLKVVGEKCLSEVIGMLEEDGVKVLNLGTDGECLQLATMLPDGTPGTSISLLKQLYGSLKQLKKDRLIDIVAKNPKIDLSNSVEELELNDDDDDMIKIIDSNYENHILDEVLHSASLIENEAVQFTVEDVEEMLSDSFQSASRERLKEVKGLSAYSLRKHCLNYIFPVAKSKWLSFALGGKDYIVIAKSSATHVLYFPNSIFQKDIDGMFRTVSFDYAHIINLCREHAAKDRLVDFGLRADKLAELSKQPGYEYLSKIIALKGNKLEFDSMNQQAAASLFSLKTAQGLSSIGDESGSHCLSVFSRGFSALDQSGVRAEVRIDYLIQLKSFVEEHVNLLERHKRPGENSMTNELLQMILTTIDSYFFNSLNLEFFNVRRKGNSFFRLCPRTGFTGHPPPSFKSVGLNYIYAYIHRVGGWGPNIRQTCECVSYYVRFCVLLY